MEDLTSRCFDEAMVLSRVGDIICERVEDRIYVFIDGIPLPVEKAFVYFYSYLQRFEVNQEMSKVWQELDITDALNRLDNMKKVISPSTFIKAIKSAAFQSIHQRLS